MGWFWQKQRFCSRCGSPVEHSHYVVLGEWEKCQLCTSCCDQDLAEGARKIAEQWDKEKEAFEKPPDRLVSPDYGTRMWKSW
jgi:hypothetical protein